MIHELFLYQTYIVTKSLMGVNLAKVNIEIPTLIYFAFALDHLLLLLLPLLAYSRGIFRIP